MGKNKNLSAINKKKAFKNVLSFDRINYWPKLSDEKSNIFSEVLRHASESFEKSENNCFTFGINQVIKSLQKSTSKILVISDEISPKFIGKHLVTIGLSKNPKLLVIVTPKLKEITKELFGISSIVLSAKESVSNSFVEWCQENCNHEMFLKEYKIKEKPSQTKKVLKKTRKPQLPDIHLNEIYVKSSGTKEFAFNPGNEAVLEQRVSKRDFSSDFISLDSNKQDYRPVVVKKIVGKVKTIRSKKDT